jgi:hypothetical protein
MKHAVMEVLALHGIAQHRRMGAADVLAGGNEESSRAAGRVADLVGRGRLGHFDHQRDDVSRCAELTVLPRRGDLAEPVLVQVPVGVPVLHRHVVEPVDDPTK